MTAAMKKFASPLHPLLALIEYPAVQLPLQRADLPRFLLPRREELGEEFEEWQGIDGRRGARHEKGGPAVVLVYEGGGDGGVDAGCPFAVDDGHDDGDPEALDVAVEFLRQTSQ